MDWQELIEAREHHFKFTDKTVDVQLIRDAIKEAWEHTFSKNLKYPFKVYLLKNDDPEVTKELITIAHRNDDRPVKRDWGNPQLMAPYLIGFSERDVEYLETIYQKTYGRTEEGLMNMNYFEAGIFSSFITLSLVNRGLDTAYCQNVRHNSERVQEIFQADSKIFFVISVGYGMEPGKSYNWIDPRDDIEKRVPYSGRSGEEQYRRPSLDLIFHEVKK